ncbi:gamma-glutamylcyclotransferase family protein [Curtobacterium flaccumfaciens]|uniref:gamma-glutamylcyclotransferase family protein n=1 Tax=Curtobacterium flaccumfaciens TaxID=2035 RepID=UPI001BDDD20A|nr:gamma-glutamylcyclotransferase family protein [Curtobacterium flaccumfaciens]MBT1682554.1 gamma-glutamylcyclotransferase [Curtobacterium flaccumfaciens pv. flaccumfaciens]
MDGDQRPLFAYGSLQFPTIHRAVLGRTAETVRAQVSGWGPVRLANRPFPALVARRGAVADGILFLDLSASERAQMDSFEGPFYDLVGVRTNAGVEAVTYVANDAAPLLRLDDDPARPVEWSAEEFFSDDLADYESRLVSWLASRERAAAK